MGSAKGIALIGVVRFLRANRAEASALLSDGLRPYLNEWIQTSSWYPARDLAGLLSAAARIARPSAPDEALVQMGIATAHAQARVYRDLLVGSGSNSRTFALWSTQFDSGELRRVRETKERVRFELVDFEDSSRELCRVLEGYYHGAMELNALESAQVEELACRLRGDVSCIWAASWKRREA